MKTCKGCPGRIPGCHAKCQEGIRQDRERKDRKRRIQRESLKDREYLIYKTQNKGQNVKWP